MLLTADAAGVRERGFSLLDMKNYVATLGYHAVGIRMSSAQLAAVKVPTIVLINTKGYEHFVVLRRSTATFVYVADPILGNRSVPADLFADEWNGIAFVIAGADYE